MYSTDKKSKFFDSTDDDGNEKNECGGGGVNPRKSFQDHFYREIERDLNRKSSYLSMSRDGSNEAHCPPNLPSLHEQKLCNKCHLS